MWQKLYGFISDARTNTGHGVNQYDPQTRKKLPEVIHYFEMNNPKKRDMLNILRKDVQKELEKSTSGFVITLHPYSLRIRGSAK